MSKERLKQSLLVCHGVRLIVRRLANTLPVCFALLVCAGMAHAAIPASERTVLQNSVRLHGWLALGPTDELERPAGHGMHLVWHYLQCAWELR